MSNKIFYLILADNKVESFLRSLLNYFVIIICTVSMILCSRAIIRAQILKYVSTIANLFILNDTYYIFLNSCCSVFDYRKL